MEGTNSRHISSEIVAVGVMLRERGYLLSPNAHSKHTGVNRSTELSIKLGIFTEIAKGNYEKYVDKDASGESYKHSPFYVKKAEQENRDKIENQTKKEIEGISFAKMNKLDSVYRNYMTEYFQREVINKNKSLYIDFYYKVQELVY